VVDNDGMMMPVLMKPWQHGYDLGYLVKLAEFIHRLQQVRSVALRADEKEQHRGGVA
jgi:hypothetical protein